MEKSGGVAAVTRSEFLTRVLPLLRMEDVRNYGGFFCFFFSFI